jgi:hypothetical protein
MYTNMKMLYTITLALWYFGTLALKSEIVNR